MGIGPRAVVAVKHRRHLCVHARNGDVLGWIKATVSGLVARCARRNHRQSRGKTQFQHFESKPAPTYEFCVMVRKPEPY